MSNPRREYNIPNPLSAYSLNSSAITILLQL
jgi:hypothetical protein